MSGLTYLIVRTMKNNMRLIDTHCHPQLSDYDGDRTEVVQRALDKEIGLIAIGTTLTDSLAGIRLAEKYPDQPVYAAVGIHPTDEDLEDVRITDLEALLTSKKVVAIGETGLDYFHIKPDEDPQVQIDVFEQQIIIAAEHGLPLIIHCRDKNGVYDAYDETLKILIRHRVSNFVMHCFSGTWEYAEKFLALGGMLSFTGIVTFPKSDTMQDVVKRIPLDRMMIETDAPFLAPVPYRGKRCEPVYVEEVAKKISELRGVTENDIALATTHNAINFFGLEKTTV